MAPEKKKKRRAYLDDYKITGDGKYVYTGNLYYHNEGKFSLKALLTLLWVLCALCAFCCVFSGFADFNDAFRQIYIILPYFCEVLGIGGTVWALVRLSFGKDPLKEYVYTASVNRLPVWSTITFCSALLGLAGAVLHFFMCNENLHLFTAILYIALKAVCAAGALAFRQIIKNESWSK